MSDIHQQSSEHAKVLSDWLAGLADLKLADLDPSRTALVSVDMLEGFCRIGPLSSPRTTAVIPTVAETIRRVSEHGIPDEHVAVVQDNHPEDAQEFTAYPPHCITGTDEAEAVEELKALPRWRNYQHFKKNSIASHTSEGFRNWLESARVDAVIAVGVVTDLCLYTLALHLQTHNLAHGHGRRVIVPEQCTQTWDAPDHPGDLYHALFLHQLARNGVEVVRTVV